LLQRPCWVSSFTHTCACPQNPHHPPPNNLPEYPVCNTATYDVFASDNTACWHQCTPSDVLTTARLDFLKANVEKAVASVEQIYRVPTMTKALIFAMGDMAAFNNDVLEWGDHYDAVCSAATFGFCDTLLPTSFCTSGVPDGGNVVLNMVYKPTMWGGGTGGSCEFDETGRPISIGFWNHLSLKDAITSLDALGKDTAYKNEYLVGFATHEINHGLGFNIGQFLQANIVERRDVYSEPNEKVRRTLKTISTLDALATNDLCTTPTLAQPHIAQSLARRELRRTRCGISRLTRG